MSDNNESYYKTYDDKLLVTIGEIEFQDSKGGFHHYYLAKDDHYLYAGGACNVGFLPSYKRKYDSDFFQDELQEFYADLEALQENFSHSDLLTTMNGSKIEPFN